MAIRRKGINFFAVGVGTSNGITLREGANFKKDENGDIIFHSDGTPTNNMIGTVTSMIEEHWYDTKAVVLDKNEIILMNLKCMKMI